MHCSFAMGAWAQWGLGDELMVRVNARALVHPTFTIIWTVGEVQGVRMSDGTGL